jgi:CRISPR/Cas system-associated endoribonuclease Cas2
MTSVSRTCWLTGPCRIRREATASGSNAQTAAQYRSLTRELTAQIDLGYDSVRLYTARAAEFIDKHTIGVSLAETGPIL